MDSFVRNATWDTALMKEVPANQGDSVEYTSILKPTSPQVVSVSIDALTSHLDAVQVSIDGRTVDPSELAHLTLTGSSLMKITGRVRDAQVTHTPIDTLVRIQTVSTLPTDTTATASGSTGVVAATTSSHIQFTETHFSSEINNLLQIDGDGLESVEYVNIGGQSLRPTLRDGHLFVGIPHGIFAGGEYFVFFQLKNKQVVSEDVQIAFEAGTGSVRIANITPNDITNDQNSVIVAQGSGFKKIVSIQLNNSVILRKVEFDIVNDQVLVLRIPKGLPAGAYYLNIMDTDSISEVRNVFFRVHEAPADETGAIDQS